MKYLFLDDIRIPSDVTWMYIGTGKAFHESRGAPWDIVRSYTEAVSWVIANGFPDVASLDHDLGVSHYSGDYSDEKTGYDFAKFLIEYDMDTNSMPEIFHFTVHSMNPIGKQAIENLLNNYVRFKKTQN